MSNKITIGLRIKQIREEKGLTQEDLGKLLGMHKSTVQRYEAAKIEKIKLPVIEAMAQILNVNPEWLSDRSNVRTLYNNKDQYNSETILNEYDNILPIKKIKLPLLGEIACGQPIYADEQRDLYIDVDDSYGADFCLKANGESMINANIDNGDIVLIKKMSMVNNGEIAAVIIGDNATLKRVYYYPDKGKLILTPENPVYEPFVYIGEEMNEISILGKAVAVIKKL